MQTTVFTLVLLSTTWIFSQAKSDIVAWMDSTVDPCVDFYKFSCGKYIKETKLADDQASTGTQSEMDKRLLLQLRGRKKMGADF